MQSIPGGVHWGGGMFICVGSTQLISRSFGKNSSLYFGRSPHTIPIFVARLRQLGSRRARWSPFRFQTGDKANS